MSTSAPTSLMPTATLSNTSVTQNEPNQVNAAVVEQPLAQRNRGENCAAKFKRFSFNNNRSARSSCESKTSDNSTISNLATQKDNGSEDDMQQQQQSFGWGKFQPKFLQIFCSAKWALFWFCWGGALQGFIVNGFVNVVITTIERRYGLHSIQTGLVASGYDIASFFCLVPVSYFGGRKGASKPKYLAWGVVLMGLGSLVFALPHFLVGAYSATLADEDVCKLNESFHDLLSNVTTAFNESQSDDVVDLSWAVWFFLGGQLLIGAGAAPLYTLGVAYIDENVSKKMSSVYLGIYYTMAIIGPAAGYVVGGQLLLIYTDFLTVDAAEIGLTSDSNVWIGAWWIGFLIGAIACFLLAIPMFGYPKTLPGTEKLQQQKISEAYNASGGVEPKTYTKLKELPSALWALLRNPTLTCLNMAASMEGLVIAGFSAFLPKQIENQYSLSPIFAAVLVGAVTVPAGGGGTFLGGYLVKKFNLTCAGIIKMCVFSTLIATSLTTAFLLTCPNISFAGVTVNYQNPSSGVGGVILQSDVDFSLEAPCNAGCTCSSMNYDPICGVDNVLYYNPCYAGCQEMNTLNKKKIYGNCSCITTKTHNDNNNNVFQVDPLRPEATNTMCDSVCHHLPYFAALIFVLMLFTFLATMPTLSATLRCVHEDQRSFALGIQWLKVRIFGTIPAPIIFGALIDQTCILWHDSFGGDRSGACLVFNNNGMSKYMWILALCGKSLSLLFFSGAWWFYIPPKGGEGIKPEKETEDCTERTNSSNLDSK